jgi:hypothetical protein
MGAKGSQRLMVPQRYLRISEATNRLAAGMWGNLPRPPAVHEMKRLFRTPYLSAEPRLVDLPHPALGQERTPTFGPRREEAGRRLRMAVLHGELPMFVLTSNGEATAVPVAFIKKLITSRGGLTDHPIRVSLSAARAAGVEERFLAVLRSGVFVVTVAEFDVWYRLERAKRKWSSQRMDVWYRLEMRKRPIPWRPTKQSERLRNKILSLVRDGAWRNTKSPDHTGKHGIAALHRILVDAKDIAVPSSDTLNRLVDRMWKETGDAALRKAPRRRRGTSRQANNAKLHAEIRKNRPAPFGQKTRSNKDLDC